jgi:phosphonate transport system substrate-binding protein
MIRRTLLALAGAALLLAGCGEKAAEGAADAPTRVVFSILSTENSLNLRTLWTPFLADMEKETGLDIEPYFAGNYTLLIEAMKAGQVQVGWFSNNSGLQAVRRAGGEVFVRSSDPSGVDGYNAVVIVPASSSTTLDDLLRCDKSLAFGLGDVESTSGTLAPSPSCSRRATSTRRPAFGRCVAPTTRRTSSRSRVERSMRRPTTPPTSSAWPAAHDRRSQSGCG